MFENLDPYLSTFFQLGTQVFHYVLNAILNYMLYLDYILIISDQRFEKTPLVKLLPTPLKNQYGFILYWH